MSLALIRNVVEGNSVMLTQNVYKVKPSTPTPDPVAMANVNQFLGKYIVVIEGLGASTVTSKIGSDLGIKSISLDSNRPFGTNTGGHRTDFISKSYHVILWHPISKDSGYFTFRSQSEHFGEPKSLENLGKIWTKIQVLGANGFDKESKWMKCFPNSSYLFDDDVDGSILDCVPRVLTNYSLMFADRPNDYKNCLVLVIEFSDKEPEDSIPKFEFNQDMGPGLTTAKLYGDKDLVDVEIHVNMVLDGRTVLKKFSAHKAVLAVRSPVLKAKLYASMTENVIRIVDFTPETFDEFLKYLYLGRANIKDFSVELLEIAQKYEVHELIELCQKYIAANISAFSWEYIFQLIQMYKDLDILKKAVKDYYKRNEDSLRSSPSFQNAIKMYPAQFMELFISAT